MKLSKNFINFNKEFIFGEIGGIIGAPIASHIGSQLYSSVNIISAITVAGVAIGATLFWLGMRIYDKFKEGNVSKKKFFQDLAYLAPVASLLVFTIYYPSLFFLSRYFLQHDYLAVSSALIAQLFSYIIFLVSINLYRHFILRFTGRNL